MSSRRTVILQSARTAATKFIWDDRKEDEDLPRGEIEAAIKAGEVSLGEIGEVFLSQLRESPSLRGVNLDSDL